MHRYSAAERGSWPNRLAAQWQEFVEVIRALNDFIESATTRINVDMSESDHAWECDKAKAYILALTAPGGIAYHFDRPFPIGGPGAHEDDIEELMRNFGDRYRTVDRHFQNRTTPVAAIMNRYRTFLAGQVEVSLILSLTSGSARVGLRAIGLRIIEPISSAGSDPQIQKIIPQHTADRADTLRRFNSFVARYMRIQDHLAILIRGGLSIDVEDAKDVLSQGGSWNSILQRWHSLPEHLETVMSQDQKRGVVTTWWHPEASIWLRDEHDNWTTPRGHPQTDNAKASLAGEDLEGVVFMVSEIARDRTMYAVD